MTKSVPIDDTDANANWLHNKKPKKENKDVNKKTDRGKKAKEAKRLPVF